jgi:nucleotide-binding universal stress UspA family protein
MATLIRTVVAATDFSFFAHRAARRAGVLARAHDAVLQLLHVLDSSSARALLRNFRSIELEQPLRSEAERALASLANDVVAAGGTVNDRLLREGNVRDEIVAASADSDLLVLGPRGINPIKDFFLGSTAERMARMIECPMLVVKQDPEIVYDNVLVPVDFSDYSAPALRFAAELAPNATLHVFHALDYPLDGRLRTAGITDEGLSAYRDELHREAQANMDDLTARVQGRAVLGTVKAGDARALITELVDANHYSLIVLGKQGRSWLSEHILGSVTHFVLERATCDVVVVPHHGA